MVAQASIVIPLLNQPDEWLAQCVDSAIGQSVACETIAVVSPDTGPSNIALLNQRSATSLSVVLEGRHGFAAALNTGIHEASTDRVGFLLADDWLEPNAVEECLGHAADIVGTGKIQFDAAGRRRQHIQRKPPSMARFNRLRTIEAKADYLSHFLLFRKQALMAVGGVDENIGLTGPDDYDLIWTLLEHGASVAIVEKRLYNKRDHAGARLTLRAPGEQIVALEKILDKHGVFGKERRRLIRAKSRWFGMPLHVAVRKSRGSDLLSALYNFVIQPLFNGNWRS
jgi:glycosyltransferase involved in cell wall biosynthesis